VKPADRARIGGMAAASLRNRPQGTRVVKTVDAEGRVVRVLSDTDLAKKILERAGVEFDVLPGKRPTHKACECGRVFAVPPREPGRHGKRSMPSFCPDCISDKYRCYGSLANGERCGRPLRKDVWRPSAVAQRSGLPPLCRSCARVAIWQSKSPSEKAAISASIHASLTRAERSERSKQAAKARTPEERSEAVKKAWKNRARHWKWKNKNSAS
jgi:hypothetical protein